MGYAGLLTIATLFWQANEHSQSFSTMYNETWVERLYRGFDRNLTEPFEFVCYVDRPREFAEPIIQRNITSPRPSYADCIQPYELGKPMILVGLDTIVTGDCDGLADYCMTADKIALPLDPYMPSRVCNGVAIVPAGMTHVYTDWRGENDMDWMRKQPHAILDDLFPGQIQSYKGSIKAKGLQDTRIAYFHGAEKPHQVLAPWIQEHWR